MGGDVTEPSAPVGASDLLRALGLLVDGPARWGNPVASRRPGIFVVELPGGAETAPIDIVAVRRWVERVSDMLVDGVPATAATVARRLERFWLPNEPVLYIGRSARAIGRRVAAIYETPLGDPQPYAGGHWLKALANLPALRIWWAETNAHEEYEDALLSQVAARAAQAATLPDLSIVLPFANLSAPGGARKPHRIDNSLRAQSSMPPVEKVTLKRRPSAARQAAGNRTRTKPATGRPAPEPTYVSRDGLDKLGAELEELRTSVRPQVVARVKSARELGDLKENGDYEYARKEQSFVEGRIQTIEQMLKTSVVIDETEVTETARIGSTVVVEANGDEDTYLLVGSAEADPASGRISNVSPVGRALLGRRAGDEVSVQLPGGSIVYRVREIR